MFVSELKADVKKVSVVTFGRSLIDFGPQKLTVAVPTSILDTNEIKNLSDSEPKL